MRLRPRDAVRCVSWFARIMQSVGWKTYGRAVRLAKALQTISKLVPIPVRSGPTKVTVHTNTAGGVAIQETQSRIRLFLRLHPDRLNPFSRITHARRRTHRS